MYWDSTVQVSGSNFTRTAQTLGDITGLSFAAAINSTYEIEVVLRVQSDTTAGIQLGLQYSAAGATGAILYHATNAASTTTTPGNTALNTASGTAVTAANTDAIIFGKAVVITGANTGNITIQILKVTSGTATVYIGSVMKIKKLA